MGAIVPLIDGDANAASIGLALGGGGARGLAHILALEAFDELGVKPALITGTSIGAIMGAAYASGLSGRDIREHCEQLFSNRTGLMKRLVEKWPGSVLDIWNPFSPAIFDVQTVLEITMPDGVAASFEELQIPLIVVATDFHRQDQLEITRGPLFPAIAASAALPALLKPVIINGRVLIDGGFVNPLPYETLKGKTEISFAIDVNGEPRGDGESVPNSVEALTGMAQIVLRSILREKLRHHQPDVLLTPAVGRYRVLDFYKMNELFKTCETFKDEVKRKLTDSIEASKNATTAH